MTTNLPAQATALDPLCDLLDALLIGMQSDAVSADRARVARALKHVAEYAITAAEAILEDQQSHQIVTPAQALAWATAKLNEAKEGYDRLAAEHGRAH